MPEKQPFALADKAIKAINFKAVKLSEKTKSKLLIDKFDELSVIQEVTRLYEELDADARRQFKRLYIDRYIEVRKRRYNEDELDELADMYLAELLGSPNNTTKYAYDAEVLRKRDRAIESINATVGNTPKQISLDKALRYWAMQTGYYADIICEDANIQALKDAGVKKVKWYTYGDGKVCGDCGALKGKVFSITDIPDPPHPRCRCHVEPA